MLYKIHWQPSRPSHIAVPQFAIGDTVMALAGFFWGPLSDRIHVRDFYILGSASLIVYILAILATHSLLMVLVVGLIQGITIGATVMMQRLSYANTLGPRSIGAIQGRVTPFHVLATGAGGVIAGALYDVSGSYVLPFSFFIGLTLVGSVIMMLTPDPKKGSRFASAA